MLKKTVFQYHWYHFYIRVSPVVNHYLFYLLVLLCYRYNSIWLRFKNKILENLVFNINLLWFIKIFYVIIHMHKLIYLFHSGYFSYYSIFKQSNCCKRLPTIYFQELCWHSTLWFQHLDLFQCLHNDICCVNLFLN